MYDMDKQTTLLPSTLEVMVLEPDLEARQQFKRLIGGNLQFGRCIASSTLEEASRRVQSGVRIDGFFLSARFELNLLGSFVQSNRSKRDSKAANLLVLRRGTSMSAKDLKAVDADGFLFEPQVASDLDGPADFIRSFQEQIAQSKEQRLSAAEYGVTETSLRSRCSRLALAVDKGHGHGSLFNELKEHLEKMPKEGGCPFFS